MLIEHLGKKPQIDDTAYVAPTATICGDVTIGAHCRILFGAVLTAEGGPVRLGSHCIVMENAVVRGVKRHPVRIGNHVLVGPHAHLTGCVIEDEVFVATAASVFNGAYVATASTLRIGCIVHIQTRLPAGTKMPIGWVAIGDPAEVLSPHEAERILKFLQEQGFSKTVFGLEPSRGTKALTERYSQALKTHSDDSILDAGGEHIK